MIQADIFKTVVENIPLVSIDFIVQRMYDEKILLGKRVNKPALEYYFTLGGRILKNETMKDAKKRIFKNEIGIDLSFETNFLGIFEHFYDDSVFDNTSTHYINFGYLVQIDSELINLPKEQHNEYKWLSIDELLKSDEVHQYSKDYFSILQIGENK